VHRDAGERRQSREARDRLGGERGVGLPERAAHPAEQVPRGGRLAPVVDLEQPAPLVEAAPQLLDARVAVRVQHGRLRHERLGVASTQHVDREHPVLGVGHLAEWHLLPGRAREACVGIGEEPAPPDQPADGRRAPLVGVEALEPHLPIGRERLKPALELDANGQRGVLARAIRAVGDRDVIGQREAREQPLEPALVGRLGILGEQRDVLAGGFAHQQVARAAVAELVRRDLDHTRAVFPRHGNRVIARAGVAHEQLVRDALARQRAQRAEQQLTAVAHRQGDRDRAHE
jgi:hypothetical protein